VDNPVVPRVLPIYMHKRDISSYCVRMCGVNMHKFSWLGTAACCGIDGVEKVGVME
jgi:hypothetical protein